MSVCGMLTCTYLLNNYGNSYLIWVSLGFLSHTETVPSQILVFSIAYCCSQPLNGLHSQRTDSVCYAPGCLFFAAGQFL